MIKIVFLVNKEEKEKKERMRERESLIRETEVDSTLNSTLCWARWLQLLIGGRLGSECSSGLHRYTFSLSLYPSLSYVLCTESHTYTWKYFWLENHHEERPRPRNRTRYYLPTTVPTETLRKYIQAISFNERWAPGV